MYVLSHNATASSERLARPPFLPSSHPWTRLNLGISGKGLPSCFVILCTRVHVSVWTYMIYLYSRGQGTTLGASP